MNLYQTPMVFQTLPTGCHICASHKPNTDGYFRKNMGKPFGLKMFHRVIWEHFNGPVPKGYEINHVCNNRGCCNINHLECLPKKEHLIITNQLRYMAPSGKMMKHNGATLNKK
jgi:hypothetical protein